MAPTMDIEPLPVEAARAGAAEAWDTLFGRYQLPLYAYTFELVQDAQASLDIVQESFISAVRHIGQLRAAEKFGAWLFGIAHQKCLQRLRRHAIEAVPIEELAEPAADAGDNPRDWLIRKEDETRFLGALARLSSPHRAVLLLHCIEEFPLDAIAEITATSLGTVKSRLHYARRALRLELEKDNEDTP
jgi:RNA polymerase sigma-70 factor (ECF subfamily)